MAKDLSKRTFGKKICVWCGKEFIARSPRQSSCGDDHYRPCADCGQPLLVKESYQNYMKYGPRRCAECRAKAIGKSHKARTLEEKAESLKKAQKTSLEHYGTLHPMQSDEVKTKTRETVRARYGVDNVSQSTSIQDKIRSNSLKQYGVEHYSQDPTIRKHMQDGMEVKYGARTAMQVPELKAKARETIRSKYGVDNVAQADEVKQKMQATCEERFGVLYAAQAPEVIKKRTETNLLKYGAPALIFSDEFLASLIQDPSKKEAYIEFRHDPKTYILTHFQEKPSFMQISRQIGLSTGQVSEIVRHLQLQDLIQYKKSTMEDEVFEVLRSIDVDTPILRNERSVIPPRELDLYLPEYKLGIECNPTCTHNSSISFMGSTDILSPSYHQVKSKLCESAEVFVFHLFSYEWEIKQDIMISIFRNLMNKTENRVYGRNTFVSNVSSREASDFLNCYHRQGSMSASVRLGLRDESGKLVSLMTFNKARFTIGQKKSDIEEGTWELSRFCSLTNTSVIGGASKLFKHFVETCHPTKVISFSDFARSRGTLYETLGFIKVSLSDPGYVWVNLKDDSYYNRVTCQKKNLRHLFHDDTIDIENKTERQIMMEHGYVQVFDAGVIRWEWNL